MTRSVPERDWKVFRELREVALERLCERGLGEAKAVIENPDKTHHQRFLELYKVLVDLNRDIGRSFDGPKRSAMIAQLSYIHSLGVLEADELARFSDGTRETLETLANLR